MISSRRVLMAALFLVGMTAKIAAAEQWYFYVQNDSDSKMTKLYASEDGESWGFFDIGSGIKPGKSAKLIWSHSTDDQSCKQYLKAKFSDESEVKTAKIDFCNDLDDPIVFQ